MRTIVSLKDVDVDIGGAHVLRDIRLEIATGQHWGIVGNNGSGKSTLLGLIAGRQWPAPGKGSRTYDFGDGPERDAVTARERIALLGHELQDLYVARNWNFRARDIVHSGLTRTEIPQRRATERAKRAARDLLESVGLGHLADRRLLELSRGEQRRVLIARSLAFDPEILLLDEPASGLDAEAREGLEAMLNRAARRTQIVIAAHRPDDLPGFITNYADVVAGRLELLAAITDRGATVRLSHHGQQPPRSTAAAELTNRDRKPTGLSERVMIALVGVSVWLGERQVLKEFNWQLRSGEHWMITGPNGSGKSTLLRLLHAEIRPARGGQIHWPGLDDPRDVWALRRRIALVSPELQARYRFPASVFEAVASGFHSSIGLTRALSERQRECVGRLLDAFKLDHLSARPLSSLSYGQRHRTLIARTLMVNPAIVLLDEPWEGLDVLTRKLVAAEFRRRMAGGTQIICASHVGPAELDFNRSLVLEDGRIVNGDDPAGPRER